MLVLLIPGHLNEQQHQVPKVTSRWSEGAMSVPFLGSSTLKRAKTYNNVLSCPAWWNVSRMAQAKEEGRRGFETEDSAASSTNEVEAPPTQIGAARCHLQQATGCQAPDRRR